MMLVSTRKRSLNGSPNEGKSISRLKIFIMMTEGIKVSPIHKPNEEKKGWGEVNGDLME